MRMAMWSPDTGTLARDRWGFSAGWSGRVMMNVRASVKALSVSLCDWDRCPAWSRSGSGGWGSQSRAALMADIPLVAGVAPLCVTMFHLWLMNPPPHHTTSELRALCSYLRCAIPLLLC